MIAIRCEGLSKQYRIGEQERYRALRDVITDAATAPLRQLRTRLSSANGNGIPNGDRQSAIKNNFIWALDDVSFEVNPGEVVGIIGRNGAGKSTLLKILSRITKPTRGHAEINGRVGSLLEVGTGFHPELTGRENIYLNGAILGMRKAEIERKFDEIVSFAEVEKFVDTPVKRYSSGMYVRLAFAVAAHMETEVLVVDEVLAVGDAEFQRKCLGKMGDVAQGGRTVLFVSHNMGAIRSLCSSAVWLDGGTISLQGGAATVVDRYLQTTLEPVAMSFELGSLRRDASYSQSFQLLKITFNGGNPLQHAEPLLATIECEVISPVEGLSIGFGFSTPDGNRLMTVDSDLESVRMNLSKPGRKTVSARIEKLMLQPGRYVIDVGARSGDNNTLDYIPSCAQVDVMPGPKTPGMIIGIGPGVRMPASWTW
jgi:lipopolysaccharide transport system ATP-binding protein